MDSLFSRITNPHLRLVAMTGAAVLVHGYHLGVDDAAIYVPAIKRAAAPGLYPFGAEFFMSHAHLSLFPALVGGFARVTGLPSDLVIFACHVLSIFLLLLAAWRLACACFRSEAARWGGVGLLAAVLATPVAGTALAVMDPYLTARSLSAPATLFSVAYFLSNRSGPALAWLLFTAMVHPQMCVFLTAFLGCMVMVRRLDVTVSAASVFVAGLPFFWSFEPVRGPAREALLSRTYFFVSQWAWYEWVGAVAPVALLWWLQGVKWKGGLPPFRGVARTIAPFSVLFTAAAIFLNSSPRLENYTRWQPMRAFHLVYLIFFVLLGGFIAEHMLRASLWRWLALFVPLAAGMHLVARQSFPLSPLVELPGVAPRNEWMNAFLWIRRNTPENAFFALAPNYMAIPGDDQHGFRALAERSVLADSVKDSGAVSLFPELADRWKQQVEAQTGWDNFGPRDFERLERNYGVTWVIVRQPSLMDLRCPYRNVELAVCRLGHSTCQRIMEDWRE
jgi:hypothetical protein